MRWWNLPHKVVTRIGVTHVACLPASLLMCARECSLCFYGYFAFSCAFYASFWAKHPVQASRGSAFYSTVFSAFFRRIIIVRQCPQLGILLPALLGPACWLDWELHICKFPSHLESIRGWSMEPSEPASFGKERPKLCCEGRACLLLHLQWLPQAASEAGSAAQFLL